MLEKSMGIADNSKHFVYVLFCVSDSLFTISSKYISDIQPLASNITEAHIQSCVKNICDSYGRIITSINLERFLNLHTDTLICKKGEKTDKKLIVLHGETLKGFIVTQVLSVEQPEIFQKNCLTVGTRFFLTDIVRNVYVYNKTKQIVMELDVPKIITDLDTDFILQQSNC